MNAAASAALAQCRAILGYQKEPARGWWNDRLTHETQTRAAEAAGLRPGAVVGMPWDALADAQREKLRAIHDKALKAYRRLSVQFAEGVE